LEDNNTSPDGALGVTGDISKDTLLANDLLHKLSEMYGKDLVITLAQQTMVENIDSFREYKQIEASTQILVASNIKEQEGYVAKDKFTTEMLVTGMVDIIKNKSDVDEAFATVAKEYNKPDEFIQENKNLRIFNQKDVVSGVKQKTKKEVKRLKGHKLFNEETLMKSSTSNQLFDNTYKDMLILGEIDSLKRELMLLKTRQTITEHKVESIESYIQSTCDPRIYEAISLKLEGKTYKQISELLGVSTKTIGRWVSRISKET
jgi:hypothetical protein